MKRILLAACISFSVAACGPNNVGSPGTPSGSGSSGQSGSGSGSGSSGTSGQPTPYACSGNPSLIYPGGPFGTSRGGVFPDYFLGDGFWNPATPSAPAPVDDLNLSPEQTMAFHLLYCSGFKYAFLDISAVWCPHCNDEAASLPGWDPTTKSYRWDPVAKTGYVVKWLGMGGIVFSVLEQGQSPSAAATDADLKAWVQQYNTNYPMAIDPQENLVSGIALQGWPANIILDLSDMKVVEAVFGNVPTFYDDFTNYLANAP